ncbi:MAG: TrkA family potassium uptake protein [Candidatus Omnitrophota bacterium]
MQHILIIGLGHFGYSLVSELLKHPVEITVIEEKQERAELVKDVVLQVIIANAANKELLLKFAKDADCVIICISEKVDSSVLITYYLKEIGVKKIIAKATTIDHGKILKSIGANEIICPDEEAAKRVAKGLVCPDILDVIKFSEDFDIIELPVPVKFYKKTIKELNLRSKYNIEILAVRNPLINKTKIMPDADYEFIPDDTIIFVGQTQSIKKLNNLQ